MRAANALISTNGGLDAKAILLAAISLVFVGGLAYYFVFMRKGGEKKDKKELKKAGDV
jgi:hypothetical protein